MTHDELLEKLKELKKKRGEISKVEWSVGMPKNSLSRYINGHAELPLKWENKLAEYFKNGDNTILVELPKDYMSFDKIGIIKEDGSVEEIKNIDLTSRNKLWIIGVKALQELFNAKIINNLTNNPPNQTKSVNTTKYPFLVPQLLKERISSLEREISNPPKTPIIGLKKWLEIRQEELDYYKKQTTNQE